MDPGADLVIRAKLSRSGYGGHACGKLHALTIDPAFRVFVTPDDGREITN